MANPVTRLKPNPANVAIAEMLAVCALISQRALMRASMVMALILVRMNVSSSGELANDFRMI